MKDVFMDEPENEYEDRTKLIKGQPLHNKDWLPKREKGNTRVENSQSPLSSMSKELK